VQLTEMPSDNHEELTETLSLSVRADSTECTSCAEEIWIGQETCPFCDSKREPGTEAEAHLYRSRVAVFGPAADTFREPIGQTGSVPLSDWQYLQFIRDSRVLDTEQVDKMREAINELDLSSPEKNW
jgi:hypothetical protein